MSTVKADATAIRTTEVSTLKSRSRRRGSIQEKRKPSATRPAMLKRSAPKSSCAVMAKTLTSTVSAVQTRSAGDPSSPPRRMRVRKRRIPPLRRGHTPKRSPTPRVPPGRPAGAATRACWRQRPARSPAGGRSAGPEPGGAPGEGGAPPPRHVQVGRRLPPLRVHDEGEDGRGRFLELLDEQPAVPRRGAPVDVPGRIARPGLSHTETAGSAAGGGE